MNDTPSQEMILDYFETLSREMRLSHWRFTYNEDTDPSDGYHQQPLMEVDTTYGRRIAWVTCYEGLWELSADDQRHCFVHELVHLLTWGTWSMVVTDLEDHLGRQGYDIYVEAYKRAMEFETDDIAALIAPNMPLPPWFEDETPGLPANVTRLFSATSS